MSLTSAGCLYRISVLLAALSVVLPPVGGQDRLPADGVEFFEKRIRPVLVERCYRCHNSTEKHRSGLAVDHRAAIRKGGDSGPAVVPGDPDASLLLSAVRHEAKLRMPKDEPKLEPEVVADFRTWIEMGAPDPRDKPPPSNTAGEIEEKKRLYFEAGANEVWLCAEDGKMTFYSSVEVADRASGMSPEFPPLVGRDEEE